jgi:PAS domain S-box-containing protein
VSYALIVDDNEDNLCYLGALLASESYTVERASDGEQALDIARRAPPLFVVSDLLMPGMDGYTLLRHWKADPLLKDIPFIIYTATYTDQEDELLGRSMGADAYILKPFEPHAFMSRLFQVLDRKVIAMPTAPDEARDEATALKAYNAALVRRLGHRTAQLNVANRELQQKMADQGELAARQLAILNALPAHVALIDPEGVIVAVNAAWQRIGAENATLHSGSGVGESYLSVCERAVGSSQTEASQAAAGIKAVLTRSATNFSFEYRCHSPNDQRWFRMSVTPLQTGDPAGAVVMHVDITDRKLAELGLQQSQEQTRSILDSTAEGIYGVDIKGVCTFCNAAAARQLGYKDQSEMIGVNIHARHHHTQADGNSIPSANCAVHTLPLTDRGTHIPDDVLSRLDGTQFSVECWSYPLLRAGVVIGLVVSFLDTTERLGLEAKLMQAQKMEAVGRLAGGVAHDFNNALQVILGTAELLGERLATDAEGSHLVRQICNTGKRAASLTRQLLAFSRKQLLRPVVIDLNEIIRGMESMLRPMIGEDIEMNVLLDAQPQPIKADPGQIEQVLMNLAVNARDAMPEGGRIVIRTSTINVSQEPRHQPAARKLGPHVLMSVSDSGCGMDPATLGRIFEPFFTTKDAGKGTGLGLSTVYGIVSQSGGHIDVQSKLARGTTFNVYIPVSQQEAEPLHASEAVADSPRGSETILLVEDATPLRGLLAESLQSYGYHVLEAENGRRGISAGCLSNEPIDLLLTDVILPDMNGRVVADQILIHRPNIQVLFMSGYTADYISGNGVMQANTFLLEKPFTHATLLRTVRQMLDHRDAADAKRQIAFQL